MAHHEADHNISVKIGAALAALLGAGVFYFFLGQAVPIQPVTDASFNFEKIRIDTARLDRERQKLAVDASRAAQKVADLQNAVRAANLAQFGVSTLSPQQHEAAVQFTADEAAVAFPEGYDRFVSLGDDLYHTCLSALGRLQDELKAGKVTYEQAATAVVPGHEVYAETCGNALKPLTDLGLVDEKGQWVDPTNGPVILEILNRLRFAHIIELRKSPTSLLTPYEREILYTWRASNPKISAVERLKYLDQAEREIRGFPADELRGKLFFQSGDLQKAKEAYERACAAKPNDLQLKQFCGFLEKRASGNAQP